MSIKKKLLIVSILLISIPLISLGIFSYYKTSTALEASIESRLIETTDQTAKLIKQTIDSVDRLVNSLQYNDFITQVLQNPTDTAIKNKTYEFLSTMQKNNSDLIEMLVVVDKNGKMLLTDQDINANTDLTERAYIKKTLAGEPARSDVIVSKASGNTVMAITYPIKVNNNIIGIILGTIKFENITAPAAKIKIGETGYAFMIDKSGLIVYHPSKEKILKENIDNIKADGLPTLVSEMKASATGNGYYTYEGIKKFIRFTPIDNWVLAVTANYEEYMAPAFNIRTSTLIIVVIALSLAILICILFTIKVIVNPLKYLEEIMIEAGNGDLTVHSDIKTKDELQTLGDSFNLMIDNQSKIIENVKHSSKELFSASEQMAATSEEINAGTEQISASILEVAKNAQSQNVSIIETSKILVQLASLVQMAQNKAVTAKNNSEHTKATANDGRLKVQETVKAIDTISKVSLETETRLTNLNNLSKRVSSIIDTINSISDQTNLLALNAAIEAARAGEHGKGFTVVADEVRKLSEASTSGANEISSIVKEMVIEISDAVESMRNGRSSVDEGVIIAKETDDAFINIIDAINQISKDIIQIEDITTDEVSNSEVIVSLINEVATLTETTSASSEEVAASAQEQAAAVETLASTAEETSAMAYSLNNLVDKFKI